MASQVQPAPGRPDSQHDEMVRQGLANEAAKHPRKNRYSNQYPFDRSVVSGIPSVDYINASWIDLPDAARKYIIASGPMHPRDYKGRFRTFESVPDTCGDFWRMCWHHDVRIIVMLCQLQPGFTGCSRYFPLKKDEVMSFGGDLNVELKTVEQFGEIFTKRVFVVSSQGTSREICHFQFLLWPNYGVPNDEVQLADFVSAVAVHSENSEAPESPTVIHCSGGLGRSGTFITILYVLSQFRAAAQRGSPDHPPTFGFLSKNNSVDLTPIVFRLRHQRHPWMVEGIDQYVLAYETIVACLLRIAAAEH